MTFHFGIPRHVPGWEWIVDFSPYSDKSTVAWKMYGLRLKCLILDSYKEQCSRSFASIFWGLTCGTSWFSCSLCSTWHLCRFWCLPQWAGSSEVWQKELVVQQKDWNGGGMPRFTCSLSKSSQRSSEGVGLCWFHTQGQLCHPTFPLCCNAESWHTTDPAQLLQKLLKGWKTKI